MNLSHQDSLAEQIVTLRYEKPNVYRSMAGALEEDNKLEVFLDRSEQYNFLKPQNSIEKRILTGLYYSDVVGLWNEDSERLNRYQIEDYDDIQFSLEFVGQYESFRWSSRGITASLKAISEVVLDSDEDLTASCLNDVEGAPSISCVQSHFGSWNNALYFSNIDINETKEMKEEEIRNEFRRKSHELGRIPEVEEIKEDSRMPTYDKVNRRIGAIDNLHEEFPHGIQLSKRAHLGEDKFEQIDSKFNGNFNSAEFQTRVLLPVYTGAIPDISYENWEIDTNGLNTAVGD